MPALRNAMSLVPEATPTRLGAEEASAVREAIDGVLREGPWIGGPAVSAFEEQFSDYLGAGHVVGCASGTDALVLAMGALELPPDSSVLVPPNDGGYAAIAARMCGLEPVVMDVDAGTMAPTVGTAEGARRPSTSAVVLTHLHGDPVDLGELDSWRRAHGLALIEDCAQAHGARRDGIHVGSTGDAAAFSFYPTKNLGAVGDAGAVVLRDAGTAARARSLAQYGWSPRPVIALRGGRNSRLDPLQAAVLSARLPYLDARNARRREIIARYRTAAPGLDFAGDAHLGVVHHAVVRTDRRDDLVAHLAGAGVATAIHYPLVVGAMPGLDIEGGVGATPVATRLATRILSLPCAPELSDAEVGRVADSLSGWDDSQEAP